MVGVINALVALAALAVAIFAAAFARDSARLARTAVAAADDTLTSLRDVSSGVSNLLGELQTSITVMRAIRKADLSGRHRDQLEKLGGRLAQLGATIDAIDQAELGPLRAAIFDLRTALRVALVGLDDHELTACAQLASTADVGDIRQRFPAAWAELGAALEKAAATLAADEEQVIEARRPR